MGKEKPLTIKFSAYEWRRSNRPLPADILLNGASERVQMPPQLLQGLLKGTFVSAPKNQAGPRFSASQEGIGANPQLREPVLNG